MLYEFHKKSFLRQHILLTVLIKSWVPIFGPQTGTGPVSELGAHRYPNPVLIPFRVQYHVRLVSGTASGTVLDLVLRPLPG